MKAGIPFAAALVAALLAAAPAGAIDGHLDPTGKYALKPDNGPWMIMVASLYGGRAPEKADELAEEVRKKLKIPAYTLGMQTDFGGSVGPGDQLPYGPPDQVKYREFYQVAVLAGNYESIDDSKAQRDLKRVKTFAPKSVLEMGVKAPAAGALKGRIRGPLWKAFLTTNPIAPKEKLRPNKLDPLLLEMNQDGPYSLLDCPGKYTVQVATFRGAEMVQVLGKPRTQQEQKRLLAEWMSFSQNPEKHAKLPQAAVDSFELTKALRQHGYEAYVFHDRDCSVVTVGSFGTLDDPRLKRHMQIFAIDRSGPNAGKQKQLGKWGFDPVPVPIFVPRP